MEFDSVVGFFEDGRGLAPAELLLAVRQSLKESFAEVYEVVLEEAREAGTVASDPAAVYAELRRRTLEFQKTTLEKQIALDHEWDSLQRGSRTGLQWQPIFERLVGRLNRAGIGKSERDLYLG